MFDLTVVFIFVQSEAQLDGFPERDRHLRVDWVSVLEQRLHPDRHQVLLQGVFLDAALPARVTRGSVNNATRKCVRRMRISP